MSVSSPSSSILPQLQSDQPQPENLNKIRNMPRSVQLPALVPFRHGKIHEAKNVMTLAKSESQLFIPSIGSNRLNQSASELDLNKKLERYQHLVTNEDDVSIKVADGDKLYIKRVATQAESIAFTKLEQYQTRINSLISKFQGNRSARFDAATSALKHRVPVLDSWRKRTADNISAEKQRIGEDLKSWSSKHSLNWENITDSFITEIMAMMASIKNELDVHAPEKTLENLTKSDLERLWKQIKVEIELIDELIVQFEEQYCMSESVWAKGISDILTQNTARMEAAFYMNPTEGVREMQELAAAYSMESLEYRQEATKFFKKLRLDLLAYERLAKTEFDKMSLVWRNARFRKVLHQYHNALQSSDRLRKHLLGEFEKKWKDCTLAAEDHVLELAKIPVRGVSAEKHANWMAHVDKQLHPAWQAAATEYVAELKKLENDENSVLESAKQEYKPSLLECGLYQVETLDELMGTLCVKLAKLNDRPNCTHIHNALSSQCSLAKSTLKLIGVYYWCVASRRTELEHYVDSVCRNETENLLEKTISDYVQAVAECEKAASEDAARIELAEDENSLLQVFINARSVLDREEQTQNEGLARLKQIIDQMYSSTVSASQQYKGFLRDFIEKSWQKSPVIVDSLLQAVLKSAPKHANDVKALLRATDHDLTVVAKVNGERSQNVIREEDDSILSSAPLISSSVLETFVRSLFESYKEDFDSWLRQTLVTVKGLRDSKMKAAVNLYNQYFFDYEKTRERIQSAFKRRKTNLPLVHQQKVNASRTLEVNSIQLKNVYMRELDQIEHDLTLELEALKEKCSSQLRKAKTQAELETIVKNNLAQDINACKCLFVERISKNNGMLQDTCRSLRKASQSLQAYGTNASVDFDAIEDLPLRYSSRLQKIVSDINDFKDHMDQEHQKAQNVLVFLKSFNSARSVLNMKTKSEWALCRSRSDILSKAIAKLEKKWVHVESAETEGNGGLSEEQLFMEIDSLRSMFIAQGVYLNCLYPKTEEKVIGVVEPAKTKAVDEAQSEQEEFNSSKGNKLSKSTSAASNAVRSRTAVESKRQLFSSESLEPNNLLKRAWSAYHWLLDGRRRCLTVSSFDSKIEEAFGREELALASQFVDSLKSQLASKTEDAFGVDGTYLPSKDDRRSAASFKADEIADGVDALLFKYPKVVEPLTNGDAKQGPSSDGRKPVTAKFGGITAQMLQEAYLADESLLDFELRIEIARRECRQQLATIAESTFGREKRFSEILTKPELCADRESFWNYSQSFLDENAHRCTAFLVSEATEYGNQLSTLLSVFEKVFKSFFDRHLVKFHSLLSASWVKDVSAVQENAAEGVQRRERWLHTLRSSNEIPSESVLSEVENGVCDISAQMQRAVDSTRNHIDCLVRVYLCKVYTFFWGLIQLSANFVLPENVDRKLAGYEWYTASETRVNRRLDSRGDVERKNLDAALSQQKTGSVASTKVTKQSASGSSKKCETCDDRPFYERETLDWLPGFRAPVPIIGAVSEYWSDMIANVSGELVQALEGKSRQYTICLQLMSESEKADLQAWYDLYKKEYLARKDMWSCKEQ